MKPIIQLMNCSILRNHAIINEDLWIRDGKIINPETIFFDEKITADKQIDCKYALISPGFIDLQINGGYGIDFSYDINTVEIGVNKVAKGILSHGVTSFCPTLVTSPIPIYHQTLSKISKRPGDKNGATILGVHIEGPFINKQKKGAHPEEYIIDLDHGMETLAKVYGSMENVSIITIAPEKDNATKIIPELVKSGITVSLGHSMANLNQGEEAVRCGASLITHLFNAMLPFHHRDPGLVGLLSSDSIPEGRTVYYGIIADGVHTHPAALRIAHRTHPNGLVLVTDAISAMGLQEGTHHIGQMNVQVCGARAYIAGTDILCGSITTMDECVRTFKKSTNCSTVFALEAATLHPAKALQISDKKGSLNFGCDADLVFLDKELNVLSTWIGGEIVYSSR